MKQLPTAAEVRRMVEDLSCLANRLCADGYRGDGLVAEAGWFLEQFAEMLEDTERVYAILHERHSHPDYEYRITDGPRKAWDGKPDLSLEGWTKIKWERFDYHEEILWARKKEAPPEGE